MQTEQILAELQAINSRLRDIELRLTEYNAHLDYHILRTDELQETNESIEKTLDMLKAHVYKVQGAAALIVIAVTIWKLLA